MKNTHLNVWLMVIASTFFWGSNFNAAHALADHTTPLTAAAERFATAVLFFWALRFSLGKAESTLTLRHFCVLIPLGVVGVFGFNYAFFTAMHTTSSLNAALIMALSPMLSVLLSAFMLGSSIRPYQYIGIVLAFLGVTFVITGGNFHQIHIVIGDAWMLLACGVWSLYSVSSTKFAPDIPPLQFARWTVSIGATALIVMAFWVEEPLISIPKEPLKAHMILLYMSVFGTVLAYIGWIKGVYFLGADKSAIAFNLVPVFSLLVSIVLGTPPHIVQIIGMIVVLGGVVLSSGWRPLALRTD